MRKNNLLYIVAGVILVMLAQFHAEAATANVSVGQIFYSPTSTTINVGDSVTWTWVGGVHSVTSDTGIWNSGDKSSGTFTRQFNSAGNFPYFCDVHSVPASSGGSAQNATIHVQAVVNNPPSVSISSPGNGAVFTAPATFNIDATASDSDGSVSQVEFFVDGNSIGIDTTSSYSATASNLSAGTHSLTAKATDNNGATTTSAVISVTVNDPPTVSITSPSNGAVFPISPTNLVVNVTANDSDGIVLSVQFFLDNVAVGTDTSNPFSFTNNNVAAGNHTLTAVANDDRGGQATNSVSVIVNSLPTTSITNFVNGSVFAAGSNILIKAVAADSDGSVTQVQFFNGATLLGTVASSPYNFTVSNAVAGNYAFTTRATDNRGAVTTSPTVNAVVTTITLLSPVVPLSGQFQFNLSGLVVGKTNVIQSSTNLASPANWTSIKTNVAVATTSNFLDNAASPSTPRFYRVIELP